MSTFWTVALGWVVAGAVVALIFGRIARFGDSRTEEAGTEKPLRRIDEQMPEVGLPTSMR